MHFLIKLFSEITIKSEPVRRRQVRQLRNNVRRILRRMAPDVSVTGASDHLEVTLPEPPAGSDSANDPVGDQKQAVAEALTRIPGIGQVLEVDCHPLRDFDDILSHLLPLYRERLAGRRFAVQVKRGGQHSFTSQQLASYLGAELLRHTAARGVDLSHPEVRVPLEVRDNRYYLVRRRLEGLGGFPIGTLDTAMTLISGGFDSSVACYLMLRRGLRSHYLFFNLGGTTHEAGVRQTALHLWQRYQSSHRVLFISVPFAPVLAEIQRSVRPAYRGLVLKRMMLRAASHIAAGINVGALVTGESLAQVSSQTLSNLSTINRVSDQLVLRPLEHMHKQEIIALAEEIGTADLARRMPEYCGLQRGAACTRAREEKLAADEHRFDYDVLQRAIAHRSETSVDKLMQSQPGLSDVPRVSTPALGDLVVDIRHPDESDSSPLRLVNNRVVRMPFYDINQRFAELPPARRVLLYCDRGSMSELHVGHLSAQGHEAVLVYDPPVCHKGSA
ncbi:MAG: tRNA uracil 4-sulfurtransferase ThiI [Oleiphilaceae bacterium]|nr:tRNA uracil 4-sulfurtransferase ThiI [Oleiphilaceae bacterium]